MKRHGAATKRRQRESADKIDVLVDLVGHMGGQCLQVFARRPAPVQLSRVPPPGTLFTRRRTFGKDPSHTSRATSTDMLLP